MENTEDFFQKVHRKPVKNNNLLLNEKIIISRYYNHPLIKTSSKSARECNGGNMIDPEKLLSKVLAGTIQNKSTKKKKKKKQKKSDNLVGGVLKGLSSGKGLITAIGLGIGAYEILKHKQSHATTVPVNHKQPAPPPPPIPSSPATPPPPRPTQAIDQSTPPPLTGEQTLAILFIQAMVAAAHADGTIDTDEEKIILERIQEQGLEQEEKLFLLNQLHNPKTIKELAADVNDPSIAQALYSVAVSTIVVDTPVERDWLDRFAAALSLSENIKQFIEEDL